MIAIWTSVRSYVIVGLICISLMISGAEHLFLCLGLLYVLYGKMSVSTLCLFFNQFFFFTLTCMNYLFLILTTILFVNVFAHSVGWKIILVAVQTFFSLMSHLFIFAFVSFVFSDRSNKILLKVMSKGIMFSSRSFIVSGFTFKSWIHFKFIFVYVVRN